MRRAMNLRGFFLIIGIILLVFFVVHPILSGRKNEKQTEESALSMELTQLEADNRELTTQLEVVGTTDYIVSSAMSNYSYVNRNDIRFEFSNPEALYAYSEDEIRILMDEIAD